MATGLFVWLVAYGWCWFVLREKVLLADCWWLVCSERKVPVADKPAECCSILPFAAARPQAEKRGQGERVGGAFESVQPNFAAPPHHMGCAPAPAPSCV
jgi:hypothetical protein